VAAFFLVGKRQGLWWAGVVALFLALAAYATAHAWLDPRFILDANMAPRAFVTNLVVPLTLLLAPLLYDNLYLRGLITSKERTHALELKKQELLRASEVREHFIATVSHELRTPMNAILGFNAMLLSRVQDRPEALRILNHTRQSADHLLTVINDVLDHSQLQAGQLSIHSETFALRDTVQNAFGLFQLRVQSMRIDYHCIIDPDVPLWVKTDRHRLMQVLVNLLGNAIKFTHQGHVHVRVRAPYANPLRPSFPAPSLPPTTASHARTAKHIARPVPCAGPRARGSCVAQGCVVPEGQGAAGVARQVHHAV
jgi:signal transduction histidine kinase